MFPTNWVLSKQALFTAIKIILTSQHFYYLITFYPTPEQQEKDFKNLWPIWLYNLEILLFLVCESTVYADELSGKLTLDIRWLLEKMTQFETLIYVLKYSYCNSK